MIWNKEKIMVTRTSESIFKDGRIKGYKAGDVMVRDWFRTKAMDLTTRDVKPTKILKSTAAASNAVDDVPIGKMLFFNYDPKHKDTLPYYDRFPLIFPIELYDDGFLGINMHYLPPLFRARLMDALYETINNQRYNKTSKLKINYNIKNLAKELNIWVVLLSQISRDENSEPDADKLRGSGQINEAADIIMIQLS